MSKWAISDVRNNPPVRVPYYPEDESKEWITNFCQCANEAHQKANSGRAYKVFKVGADNIG